MYALRMVDIWVAISICALTAAMAYMGVHVTLHPPESHKAKRLWKAGFVSVAVLACVLIGVQTKRNDDSQSKLQAQLSKIQKQTETPPQVTVNVPAQGPPVVNVSTPAPPAPAKPSASVAQSAIVSAWKPDSGVNDPNRTNPARSGIWLIPGKDIEANIFFKNSGAAQASEVKGWGQIYLEPSDPNKSDSEKNTEKNKYSRELSKRFMKSANQHLPLAPPGIISPNGQDLMWITAHSQREITQDDIDKLASGEELLFIFYAEHYKDPSGSHYIHGCRIAQTPAFNPEVWQFCDGFEAQR